ncbi:hypothetical protein K3495_g2228 [Podosphaera aphanis]|nr:hypothetical protein K3495_g2228 [Podosphaera aphanis]
MLGFISKPRLVSQMRSDFLRKHQYKSSVCLSDTPEEKRGSRYQTRNIFMHSGEEMNEIPRDPASPEPLIPHQPIRFPDRTVPPYSTQRATTDNELLDSPLDYHHRNSHGLAGLAKGRPHLYKASSYSPLLAPRAL